MSKTIAIRFVRHSGAMSGNSSDISAAVKAAREAGASHVGIVGSPALSPVDYAADDLLRMLRYA